MSSWPKDKANVIMTWPHAALGHQMSPPGMYILSLCALHLKSWPNSSSLVHIIWKDDLILLLATRCHYWGVHLIFMCTSSENMSSFWVCILHHRGLFYERPINPETYLLSFIFYWYLLLLWLYLINNKINYYFGHCRNVCSFNWWFPNTNTSCVLIIVQA